MNLRITVPQLYPRGKIYFQEDGWAQWTVWM